MKRIYSLRLIGEYYKSTYRTYIQSQIYVYMNII